MCQHHPHCFDSRCFLQDIISFDQCCCWAFCFCPTTVDPAQCSNQGFILLPWWWWTVSQRESHGVDTTETAALPKLDPQHNQQLSSSGQFLLVLLRLAERWETLTNSYPGSLDRCPQLLPASYCTEQDRPLQPHKQISVERWNDTPGPQSAQRAFSCCSHLALMTKCPAM